MKRSSTLKLTATLLGGALLLAVSLPAAAQSARWEVDQAHSSVLFFVPHFDLARSIGRFNAIEGEFRIDPKDPTASQAEVRIAVASLDMGDARFTETLLGEDWFDAQTHPQIRFRSTEVKALDEGQWQLTGELSIRERSAPVSLLLQRYRCATPPLTGRYSCGYSLVGTLDRNDFGLDRHPRYVGAEVELRIELELQREKPRGGQKLKR
jgi:polyisoprenoid-binding protein YceI